MRCWGEVDASDEGGSRETGAAVEAPPARVAIAVSSLDELHALYRDGLGSGRLVVAGGPRRAAVGTAVELCVTMGTALSITVSAHVVPPAADTPSIVDGVPVAFSPMSDSELMAISALLRETVAVRPDPFADGTGVQHVAELASCAGAYASIASGDLDAAAAEFDEVLAHDPTCAAAIEGLAIVALRRRERHTGRLARILGRAARVLR